MTGGKRPLKVLLVLGSTRAKRVGPKVGAYLGARLLERGHEVTTLDPRESCDGFFMRLMDKPLFHYKSGEAVPAPLAEADAMVRAADGVVVVAPEMNHTVSPGLVNLLSHFGASRFANKPSGIATYSAGMWGGARAGVALRPFLSELGCLPVSATFQLAGAWKDGTFDAEGNLAPGCSAEKSAVRMIEQFEWHAYAMRAAREEAETAAEDQQ